jgi:diacylglycerol kinase (ATP)
MNSAPQQPVGRTSGEGPAASSPSRPGNTLAQFPWRAKNPLGSFRHAVEGVVHTFRTQRNMRFHFVTVALVLLSGLLFRLERVEMLVLLFTSSLVLIAEMFNTAVEVVVDMITQSYHPAAKYAKDVAAGAVLIAAINAVVVGCVLFLWNGKPEQLRLRLQEPPTMYVFIAGFLLLLILLVVWKVLGEKGTLLQGGVVSGHSAIAFFLATTILFVANNVFAAVLALLLALLVAQSRVEAHIHTVQEVLIGAALALLLTASIYRLPSWVGRHVMRAGDGPASLSSPQPAYPASTGPR